MTTQNKRYLAYLLRLWQVQQGGQWLWRASLEDSRTGEQHGFASPEKLIEFLWAQMLDSQVKAGQSKTSNLKS